jgi:hypothetical protein
MGIYTNLPYIMGGYLPNYVGMPGLISPEITWEKVKTSNIGLDAGFLRNRLNVSFDYFIRNMRCNIKKLVDFFIFISGRKLIYFKKGINHSKFQCIKHTYLRAFYLFNFKYKKFRFETQNGIFVN